MRTKIKLLNNYKRPAINLYISGLRFKALFDTGAVIPVFTNSHRVLQMIGGTLQKKNITFGGFGGKTTGDLYRVTIKVGDLLYESMPIICAEDSTMPFDFIFSATMLTGFRYTIDDDEREMLIDTKNEEIGDNGEVKLHIRNEDGSTSILFEDLLEDM